MLQRGIPRAWLQQRAKSEPGGAPTAASSSRDASVDSIVAMGFDGTAARAALDRAGGAVGRALDDLLRPPER